MTKLNRETAGLDDDNGDEDYGEETQPHETVPQTEPDVPQAPPPPAE